MPGSYVKIQSVTVGSGGAANIEFTSIPGTFDDLELLWTMRQNSGADTGAYLSLNGSTSNFSGRYLYSDGVSISSASLARYVGSCPGTEKTANTFASSKLYIPNYTGNTNKSFSVDNVDENNGAAANSNFIAGLWSNTAAITSITITPGSGSLVQYSTAYLYGIKKS